MTEHPNTSNDQTEETEGHPTTPTGDRPDVMGGADPASPDVLDPEE